MSLVVQLILLVMAFGHGAEAQNVAEGFDFQLFMVKFGNLEQIIGQLQTDIRKQDETLDGLTSKIQQLETQIKKQGESLGSHSMQLSTISEESTRKAQQLQIEIRKHAEMTEYYYGNLMTLLNNGEDSCVAQNVTKSGPCQLQTGNKTIEAYCEEDLYGGGWIVIQNRFEGSVDFYRNWTQYRNGFGEFDGEYWLGLENVHLLTSSKDYELLVHLESFEGVTGFSQYLAFVIGGEHEGYPLKSLGSYSGTAGDSLDYHLGQMFSTYDRDNDPDKALHCAVEFHGAWWYKSCCQSTLNGRWKNERTNTMFWKTFSGPLRVSRMMIRKV